MVGGPVGERRVPRRRCLGPEFGFLFPECRGPEVRRGEVNRDQVITRLSWFGGPRSQSWAGGGLVGVICQFRLGWRWVGGLRKSNGVNGNLGANGTVQVWPGTAVRLPALSIFGSHVGVSLFGNRRNESTKAKM